ncbi:MAG: barstar family protein [Rhodospirillaceae bacterium]
MSKDAHNGGLYAAPADTRTTRALYGNNGDVWRSLDLVSVRDKAGLLDALSRALDFPADFGHNWDALSDALQDLSWLEWSRLVIEVTGVQTLRHRAPADWSTALDIFRGAATYWASRQKTFLVLVHGASDLPALRA